ncbi:MAG TPA: hypothetical protein VLL77_01500 [Anaerolineales bacterium]|nr:hypothetical protein [Anaerolineales bacterium]
MSRIDGRIVAGLVLIGFGALFFLQTMGLIPYVRVTGLWAVLFGGAGLVFLFVFIRDRSQWWAVLPGLPLVGLAGLLLMDALSLPVTPVGPALFLGSIGLAFWLVYWVRRDFWWAIIPGGIVASVALLILLEPLVPEGQAVGLIFLGIGLTFFALYLLPPSGGRQPWAIYPAAVLLILAAAFSLAFGVVGRFLLPLAVIMIGAYLVYRAWRRPSSPSI